MNKQEIENSMERLEALSRYAQILKHPDEFFHHMNGHTTELSLVLAAFDIAGMAQDIQNELRKQLTNGWIPVTERLPENKVNVLIAKENGTVRVGFCNVNYNEWREDGYLLYPSPIAWQPLPEPYKEPPHE